MHQEDVYYYQALSQCCLRLMRYYFSFQCQRFFSVTVSLKLIKLLLHKSVFAICTLHAFETSREKENREDTTPTKFELYEDSTPSLQTGSFGILIHRVLSHRILLFVSNQQNRTVRQNWPLWSKCFCNSKLHI